MCVCAVFFPSCLFIFPPTVVFVCSDTHRVMTPTWLHFISVCRTPPSLPCPAAAGVRVIMAVREGRGSGVPDAYLTCGRRMQMTTARNSDLHVDCNMLFTEILRLECRVLIGGGALSAWL